MAELVTTVLTGLFTACGLVLMLCLVLQLFVIPMLEGFAMLVELLAALWARVASLWLWWRG